MKTQKILQLLVGVLFVLALMPLTSIAMASASKQDGTLPGADFVPGELIVGLTKDNGALLKTTEASVTASVAAVNAEIVSVAIDSSFYLVRFKSDTELRASMDALAATPGVAYVVRNGIIRIHNNEEDGITRDNVSVRAYAPNDPGKGNQWYLNKILYYQAPAPVDSVNVPCVVVFDTGVNYNHPDLTQDLSGQKVYPGADIVDGDNDLMDVHGHGTRVAGIIAARTNNAVGIAGVSPYSNILAVRVLNEIGQGTYANFANGIIWANTATENDCGGQKPKIYNFSLSGELEDQPEFKAALATARSMGRLVVATSGDIQTKPLYPGAYGDAFGVASSENNDRRAYKSNLDDFSIGSVQWLDFVAPGYKIFTTTFDPANPLLLYETSKGIDPTLGAAVVSGAAARVWASNPTFTADEVRQRLVDTADPTRGGFMTPVKRLNLAKALGYNKIILQGQIFNARTVGPLYKATVTVLNSLNKKICSVLTNASGFYTCVLPAKGKYTIQARKTGYISFKKPVTRGTESIFNANISLSPVIGTGTSGDWSVTILWKGWQPFEQAYDITGVQAGKELDLWVVKPSKPVKCYAPMAPAVTNKNILLGTDSWGAGQTENIRIRKAFGSPVQVWVSLWDGPTVDGYNWPVSSRITGSGLTVAIYKNNKLVAQRTVPNLPTTTTSDAWYVGIINPATGTWKLVNKIYTHVTAPACIIEPK